MEQERLENERLEQKRLEDERLELERLEKEKLERIRLENERIEQERLEKERAEKERLEQKRLEQEKLEQKRLEAERKKQEETRKKELEMAQKVEEPPKDSLDDSFSMDDFEEIEEDLDQLNSVPSEPLFKEQPTSEATQQATESIPPPPPQPTIKKGGIRGLRELKKKKNETAKKNPQESQSPDQEIAEECLLPRMYLQTSILEALQEHFMTEDQLGEFISGSDFDYMKFFNLFQDLISENFLFFFDSGFTEKILESLRVDKFMEKETLEEFEDRFEKLSACNKKDSLGRKR